MAGSVKTDALNLFSIQLSKSCHLALDGTHAKCQIPTYHSFGQPGSLMISTIDNPCPVYILLGNSESLCKCCFQVFISVLKNVFLLELLMHLSKYL